MQTQIDPKIRGIKQKQLFEYYDIFINRLFEKVYENNKQYLKIIFGKLKKNEVFCLKIHSFLKVK